MFEGNPEQMKHVTDLAEKAYACVAATDQSAQKLLAAGLPIYRGPFCILVSNYYD